MSFELQVHSYQLLLHIFETGLFQIFHLVEVRIILLEEQDLYQFLLVLHLNLLIPVYWFRYQSVDKTLQNQKKNLGQLQKH